MLDATPHHGTTHPKLPRTLTRTQLTLVLILVPIAPVLLGVVLWNSLPDIPEPKLTADVRIGAEAIDGVLVPCVILKNPTDEPWRNVNLSINKLFDHYHPEPIPAGQQIQIPLNAFHTKGNQYFPPEKQKIKLLIVYAQISDNSRAVVEFNESDLRQ
jgi:hypothetical protein